MMLNIYTYSLFIFALYFIAVYVSRLIIKVADLSSVINTTEKIRYKSIDGLRGVLAVSVFVHHTFVTWFYIQTGEWKQLPSNFYNQLGESAVALFFMITAFLFFGRMLDQEKSFDWKYFFISRFFRIYPLYFVALLVVFLIVLFTSGLHLKVPISSLVVQVLEWIRFGSTDINQVAGSVLITARAQWSILYEFKFYVAILPMFWLVLVLCGRVLLILTILFYFSYLVFGAYQLPYIGDIKILCFFGGIFSAYYVRRYPQRAHSDYFYSLVSFLVLGVVMVVYKSAYDLQPILLLTIFFTIITTGNTLFGLLVRPSLLWLGK